MSGQVAIPFSPRAVYWQGVLLCARGRFVTIWSMFVSKSCSIMGNTTISTRLVQNLGLSRLPFFEEFCVFVWSLLQKAPLATRSAKAENNQNYNFLIF